MGDVFTRMWDLTLLFNVLRLSINLVVFKLHDFDKKYCKVLNQTNLDFTSFDNLSPY